MARKKKAAEVINGEVNEVVETMENSNGQGAEVIVENVPAEVGAGDAGEVAGQAGDAAADGEGQAGTVETASKTRRSNGQGSVYPLTSSGKGWGYCIQLSANKELRKLYGNKLRHLGTGKTYEETEAKCADAIANRESLLAAKLEKLGHKAPAQGEG